MNSRYTYSEQELCEAVKTSTSIRQVLEKLDIVPAGGNYQTTNRRIQKLNIDISHFTGQAWNKGKTIGPKRPIEEYLKENSVVQSFKLKCRLISEGLKEHKCECCGITEWNGNPAPIELDHINGNHNDNRLENLCILCPNCHTQTDTYRGKNKGKS
jgi:Zn finger protein HypA/HybF involved in hydrogenase expression